MPVSYLNVEPQMKVVIDPSTIYVCNAAESLAHRDCMLTVCLSQTRLLFSYCRLLGDRFVLSCHPGASGVGMMPLKMLPVILIGNQWTSKDSRTCHACCPSLCKKKKKKKQTTEVQSCQPTPSPLSFLHQLCPPTTFDHNGKPCLSPCKIKSVKLEHAELTKKPCICHKSEKKGLRRHRDRERERERGGRYKGRENDF